MKKAFLLITVMALTAIPPLATANAGQPTSALTELTQQRGVRETLMGRISTIDNVRLVLQGTTGTLSYKMNGKRIVSKIEVDMKESKLDENGFGRLVLKSYTPKGKLKGRFIGEADTAECGYLYRGEFVNVNGGTAEFLFCEV